MIHKIVISPTTLMRKTTLPHCYTVPGTNIMRILTESFEIKEYETSKYLADPKGYVIEHFKDLDFDINTSMNNGFSFETHMVEGIEVGLTPMDVMKKKALELFYFQHPLTVINGKSHPATKTPNFNILDTALQSVAEVIDFDKELSVKTSISKMDLEELRDVAYYFGKSPKGMNDGELKVFLAGNNNGLCLNRVMENSQPSNIDKFIKVFIEGISAEDRDMKVTIRKALELHIITNNPKNGIDSFYLGATPLGQTIDDMVAYFHKDETLYKTFVKRAVIEKQDFKKETADSAHMKQATSTGKMSKMSQVEITTLVEEAKRLKKEGFIAADRPVHNMKLENLMPLIETGRIAKAEKETQPA